MSGEASKKNCNSVSLLLVNFFLSNSAGLVDKTLPKKFSNIIFLPAKKLLVHNSWLFHMQGASHVLSVIHEILAHHRLVYFYFILFFHFVTIVICEGNWSRSGTRRRLSFTSGSRCASSRRTSSRSALGQMSVTMNKTVMKNTINYFLCAQQKCFSGEL